MIGASDLDGYASTVVTLALLSGKRVEVLVSSGLATPAELLRLNASGPGVSVGAGVRKSESGMARRATLYSDLKSSPDGLEVLLCVRTLLTSSFSRCCSPFMRSISVNKDLISN